MGICFYWSLRFLMPKLVLFVPCLSTAVDFKSNVLSVFNIFEELTVPRDTPLDKVRFSFEVVSLWIRQQGEENSSYVQRQKLFSPNGEEIGGVETTFVAEKARQRLIIGWEQVPVPQLGIYTLTLWIKKLEDQNWPDSPEATYQLPIHNAG